MDIYMLGVDQILRLEGSRGHDGGGMGSGTCGHCFLRSLSLSLSLSLLFLGGRSGMIGIGIRANLGGSLVLGC
jgi:hypothetical protein